MTSLNKLSKTSLLISLSFIFYFGCDKKSETKEYVARVNDSFLTEGDIQDLDSLYGNAFARNEIIKRWIDTELLYQEAEKKGITKDENFLRVINNSRKQLAAAFLKNNILDEKLEKPSISELSEYYEKHVNEFKADEETYVYNLVIFSNEAAAIKFRNKFFELGWDKTTEIFSEDKSLIEHSNNVALYKSNIYPIKLLNMIQELNPGEISIILESSPSKFYVVQLIQMFNKGNTLPFEIVQDRVEAQLVAQRSEEIFQDYLKELYSDNEVEIKERHK